MKIQSFTQMNLVLEQKFAPLERDLNREPVNTYVLAHIYAEAVFQEPARSLSAESQKPLLEWKHKFLALHRRARALMNRQQIADADLFLDYENQQKRLNEVLQRLLDLEKELGEPVTVEALTRRKEQNRARYNTIGKVVFTDWEMK